MTAYAQRLNQEADRAAAAHKAAKEAARLAEVEAVREKMVILDVRLKRLIDTIPVEIQRES